MPDPGSIPLATLEVDLDRQLRYAKGTLVLHADRLVDRTEGAGRAWPLGASPDRTLSLRHSDHAGLGMLELFEGERRVQV